MAYFVDNSTAWMPYANGTNATDINQANAIQTYCIIFCGLLLNLIAAILWTKPGCSLHLRTCPTIIMAALVWVDLLSITGYIIRGGLAPILKQTNPDLFCDLFGFTNIMFSLTSGLIAAIMSVDRFAAISTPFIYRAWFTPQRITISILLLVAFSALVGSLPFVGIGSYHKVNYFHGQSMCKLAWFPDEPPLHLLHFAAYQTVGWSLIVIVLLCNVGVIRTLLKMRRHVAAAGRRVHSADTRREVRFARTMILITTFFALCWVPWMITTILIKVGSHTSLDGDLLATRLLLANSAFDPLIFMATSEVFCSRLRKMITHLQRLCTGKRTDSVSQLVVAFDKLKVESGGGTHTDNGSHVATRSRILPSLSRSLSLNPVITVSEASGDGIDAERGDGPTDVSDQGLGNLGASSENVVVATVGTMHGGKEP